MSCCVLSVVIGQDALVGYKMGHQFDPNLVGTLNRSSKNGVQRKIFPKERHCGRAACKQAIVPVVTNVRGFQVLIGSVYSRGGSGRLLVLRWILDDIW